MSNTATTTQHTPTPWMVVPEVESNGKATATVARAPGGYGMAITGWGCVRQKPEDAAFIVRACNSHEQLVAALKDARELLALNGIDFTDEADYGNGRASDIIERMDAALAAAGA